jgi:hypothetical protein
VRHNIENGVIKTTLSFCVNNGILESRKVSIIAHNDAVTPYTDNDVRDSLILVAVCIDNKYFCATIEM